MKDKRPIFVRVIKAYECLDHYAHSSDENAIDSLHEAHELLRGLVDELRQERPKEALLAAAEAIEAQSARFSTFIEEPIDVSYGTDDIPFGG